MRRCPERLRRYRPLLDRTVFGVAMLGLLVAAHIALQHRHGFEQGCTGFSPSLFAGSAFDCAAVTGSGAGTLLGVPNAIWGMFFYFFVAALTAIAAFDVPTRRAAYKALRTVLVAGGFAYTSYLVYYQFFVLEQLCVLCLVSAGLVTVLTVLHGVELARQPPFTNTERSSDMIMKPYREMRYMGGIALLLVLLVGADLAWLGPEEPPDVFASEALAGAEEADDLIEAEQTGEFASQSAVANLPSSLPDDCRYDPEKDLVRDFASLVNFFDPSVGNPDASVTVIEYFDPNCGGCKAFHEVVMPVVHSHVDQARFVFKPFVLWNHSVIQAEALYAAAQEGKFFEMLAYQYEMQNPQTGLSALQLRTIAEEIGMDAGAMMRRIESGLYRRTLQLEKEEAIGIGVNSTPTVLINGRFVDRGSHTVDCLRGMIEEAGKG